MATLDSFIGRVERKLVTVVRIPKNLIPPKMELRELVVDAIRYVQDGMPNDALKDLFRYHEYTMDGTDDYIDVPVSNILRFISLKSEESDGEYGYPWDFVPPERLDELRRLQDDASFDATNTRVFAVRSITDTPLADPVPAASHEGYYLYPTPVDERKVKIDYIVKATEDGDMSLPDFLHELVINKVVGEFSDRHYLMFKDDMANTKIRYRNIYGLSTVKPGVMRDMA